MNQTLVAAAQRTAVRRRGVVAGARFSSSSPTLITEIVQRWDADEISQKIETELGPDLQFIRLNGSLVGGAAGVVLHAALVRERRRRSGRVAALIRVILAHTHVREIARFADAPRRVRIHLSLQRYDNAIRPKC